MTMGSWAALVQDAQGCWVQILHTSCICLLSQAPNADDGRPAYDFRTQGADRKFLPCRGFAASQGALKDFTMAYMGDLENNAGTSAAKRCIGRQKRLAARSRRGQAIWKGEARTGFHLVDPKVSLNQGAASGFRLLTGTCGERWLRSR